MPKSRRDKKVTLSKTKKKVGLEVKSNLISRIQSQIDVHQYCYVISVENSRASHLQEVRQSLKGSSVLFFGKNKVMIMALCGGAKKGREGLETLTSCLQDQRGLIFSNLKADSLISRLETEFQFSDYLRTGSVAKETVSLTKGPVAQFSHAIEPQMRKLGLPTELDKGVVRLTSDFTVCTRAQKLTSEQARILKLFDMKHATFRIKVLAAWDKSSDSVESLDKSVDLTKVSSKKAVSLPSKYVARKKVISRCSTDDVEDGVASEGESDADDNDEMGND